MNNNDMLVDVGGVYLCEKRLKKGKYYLELVENRDINISGDDLEWCKVEICSQIILWNGDGEAVLEFLPEKIKKTKAGVELYRTLTYNEGVNILNTIHPFEGGRCSKCSYELGERNDELLNLESKPKNSLVCIDRRVKRDESDNARFFKVIEIYRQSFIDLFTKEEKELFTIKPILLKGKSSEFIELIPKRIINVCGYSEANYYDSAPGVRSVASSWYCSECKREHIRVFSSDYKYNVTFVDPKTIRDYPTMFFLNDGMHTSLVIRNDRWLELLQHKKELKGIATNPVIVLEEKYVEYPELEEPEKFEW